MIDPAADYANDMEDENVREAIKENLREFFRRNQMKWTTEPPTEPGYYWLKYIDKDTGVTKELCRLRKAKVYLKVSCWWEPHPVGHKGLYVRKNLPEFIKDVKPLGWAGPIPEPEEE